MTDKYLVWKVALGVLIALSLWEAIGRYQANQAIREFNEELSRIAQNPDPLGWRRSAASQRVPQPTIVTKSARHPVPPGFQCLGKGVLARHSGSTWIQITSSDNYVYCPPGGTQHDCFRVTPTNVDC
ncbi:MAG TPA: hypothetical protein PKD77_08550 [Rudaea sp.]|nr:hypothetical protein [Rudaea sp.]